MNTSPMWPIGSDIISTTNDSGIFIDYLHRSSHNSTGGHVFLVQLLTQELSDHFGVENVVAGTSTDHVCGYPDKLRIRFANCNVLLVVIHSQWLDDLRRGATGSPGVKSESVHYGIRNALHPDHRSRNPGVQPTRRQKVIPVLLDEVDPPRSDELPDELRELAFLQAFRLRFGSLDHDIARLVTELEIHVLPAWPLLPITQQQTSAGSPDMADRNVAGHATTRWLVTIFSISALVAFAPAGRAEWSSPSDLALWSAMTITVTFLTMAAITLFARPLHQLERHIHSRPKMWLLTIRLGLAAALLILFQPFLFKLEGIYLFITLSIAIPGIFILLLYIFDLGIKDIREEDHWPPAVTAQPIVIRRSFVRLEYCLVSLWRPPLSRLQRDQARMITRQLHDAVATLRKLLKGTHRRRDWLRVVCPKLTAGYAVWLTLTAGLTIASIQERFSAQHYPGWYLVLPIGALSGVLGLGSMELLFRHHRRTLRWFIKETEDDLDNLLKRQPGEYSTDTR